MRFTYSISIRYCCKTLRRESWDVTIDLDSLVMGDLLKQRKWINLPYEIILESGGNHFVEGYSCQVNIFSF